MTTLIKLILVIGFLQIKCFAFAQTVSSKGCYIFTFSTVYSSGLVDMGFIAFEDLHLMVSDSPVKIDSIMSVLSKKNYTSMSRILDTLGQQFKIYKLVENDSKSKGGVQLNKNLTDYNNYKTGYLFSLNDTIKKYSSVVGYVIHRYSSKAGIKYKVLSDECDDFPKNECRAMITNL